MENFSVKINKGKCSAACCFTLLHSISLVVVFFFIMYDVTSSLSGLTVMWWGHYGFYIWHKPTELAHSFLFCSCVYF